MYLYPDIVVQHNNDNPSEETEITAKGPTNEFYVKDKAMLTTIPFVKENEFNYSELISWTGENYKSYVWIIFIPIVIFIITAVSNGANLTDGIDGLAAGT